MKSEKDKIKRDEKTGRPKKKEKYIRKIKITMKRNIKIKKEEKRH